MYSKRLATVNVGMQQKQRLLLETIVALMRHEISAPLPLERQVSAELSAYTL